MTFLYLQAAWLSHLHDAQKHYKAATHRHGSVSSSCFSFDSSFNIHEEAGPDSVFTCPNRTPKDSDATLTRNADSSVLRSSQDVPFVTLSKPPKLKDVRLKKQKSLSKEPDMYNHWNKSLDDVTFAQNQQLEVSDPEKVLTKSLTELNIHEGGETPDVDMSQASDWSEGQNQTTIDSPHRPTQPSVRTQNHTQTSHSSLPASGHTGAISNNPHGHSALTGAHDVTVTSTTYDQSCVKQVDHLKSDVNGKDISKSPTSTRHGSPLNRVQRLNMMKVIHEKSHSKDSLDVMEPIHI